MKSFFEAILKALSGVVSSPQFKTILIDLLHRKLVVGLLKKFLLTGGIKGWISKYVANHLFDELVKPAVLYSIREGNFIINTAKGHIKVTHYEEAEENGNEDDYLDHISSV